ncbi:MAG: methionine--tRNA ligase [Candidatus Aenigmarchaeota archaeon]|nr:methionine--tRNA ligase [Candidatus Aenigmarchaeota archaeon]NIP41036.1 methionine--tRNA ligase [Candidatus Aenigmarchaeota archaeon]NIQ17438.1 methionine--tRNA ligase [Candidatus Aenigmarchaeota archaeon]NIS73632.1 methionine--tRNA ligase [Candidatus Aenigmarchaeota archaeon]
MVIKTNFYVTTAIDYVNAKPHIGHAYEKVIADIIARFRRLRGEKVFYLTGTDENAQKNSQAAKEAGVPTKKFVDRNVGYFKDLIGILNISNDHFIRTTEDTHIRISQEIFRKVFEKGDIYKGFYEGLYCEGCESYLTEKDLVDGKCPEHQKPPQPIREEAYFFRLSKYRDRIIKLLESPDFVIPKEKRNEMLSRIKSDELKDLCVSRKGLDWGIDIPVDKDHKIYVWFDALINYVSALDYPVGRKFKEFWPADAHVIGKGINWFHSVIWPAMLISAGIKPPRAILVHGYLTVNGQKISKSLGTQIDPAEIVKNYGSDPVRYFFAKEIPMGEDGDFSTKDLVDRVNNELVANISNFCYRTLSFINNYSKSRIGKATKGKWEGKLKKEIEGKVKDIEKSYEKYAFHEAIKKILEIGDIGNRYFQENEPWVLVKKDPKACAGVLSFSANIVKDLAILLKPVLPEFSEKLEKQLNLKDLKWKDLKRKLENHRIGKAEIIFKKVSPVQEDPFSSLDLKVAKVERVEDHPEADKLYVLKIDLGTEKRTLVAGLKGNYSKRDLEGKKIVVVANLKPAKLRGIESKGMLLAVESKGKIGLLTSGDKEGTDVLAEGIERKPKRVIDIKDFLKLDIEVKKGKVYYKDKTLRTEKSELTIDRGIEGKVC